MWSPCRDGRRSRPGDLPLRGSDAGPCRCRRALARMVHRRTRMTGLTTDRCRNRRAHHIRQRRTPRPARAASHTARGRSHPHGRGLGPHRNRDRHRLRRRPRSVAAERRQQRQRIHVGVRAAGNAHAEMQVRLRLGSASGHAHLADAIAGLDPLASPDRGRAQVQVAGDVGAVRRLHRDRQTRETQLRGVRDLARAGGRDRGAHRRADVYAAMHAAGVRARVVIHVVRDDRPPHGPDPIRGRRPRRQRAEQGERHQATDPQPRLP
jgi:hypothetical protein